MNAVKMCQAGTAQRNGDDATTISFRYHRYQSAMAAFEGLPKPNQQPHPSIFVAGTAPRMLRLPDSQADIVGFVPKTLPRGVHDWLFIFNDPTSAQIDSLPRRPCSR